MFLFRLPEARATFWLTLRWPELDVDLAVGSIDHPEDFPLVSGARR
jgi:hypothetical protein